LLAWQRALHELVTRPLDASDRTRRTPLRGRPAAARAAALVKPSATLAPLERVEIYNRMYWFRVFDSLGEDLPGLRALLGEERFWNLARAYLEAEPSRSPTLRDLPARLPAFLRRQPRLAGPHAAAAVDLARYEWAQVTAFDGAALRPLRSADVRGTDPGRLRFRLQPHLTLLTLDHPVDEFWHAVKRGGAFRAEASNATLARRRSGSRPTGTRPLERRRVHLAVHRFDGRIFTKRLEPGAAAVLGALGRGVPLADAATRGARGIEPAAHAARMRRWFEEWMRLGWLCAR
jgi:hypothetical protein